jgi:hypothetical protein
MASTSSDSSDLLARYLAGQLTPAELDAFERTLPDDAKLREELEQLLKLKEGLARLRDRGELDAIVQAPARNRWLPLAAAAAAAIVLVALVWSYLPGAPPNVLASSLGQLVVPGQPAPTVATPYVLAHTRGSPAVTQLERAGVVELQLVPSTLSSEVSYSARLGPAAGGRIVGRTDAIHMRPDGYLTLYLDTSHLTPGDYELQLSPSHTTGSPSQIDRFAIHVR